MNDISLSYYLFFNTKEKVMKGISLWAGSTFNVILRCTGSKSMRNCQENNKKIPTFFIFPNHVRKASFSKLEWLIFSWSILAGIFLIGFESPRL
jgi:hypothetical protein